MKKLIEKHADKLRFAVVGSVSTVIDFGTLFTLVHIGLKTLPSNYISTLIAMIFSFTANKKYTFKNTQNNHGKQIIKFLVVTLIGLWIIQPIVISFSIKLLTTTGISSSLILLVAKAGATAISMIWNYVLYKKFVF